MMMMCRATTRLMSKQLDGPINFRELMMLRIHTAICRACRRCQRQFTMLHEVGDRLVKAAPDNFETPEPHHREAVEQARLSSSRHYTGAS